VKGKYNRKEHTLLYNTLA